MKTIRLLGDIAEQFKPEWHLYVDSPAEAIRAIDANRPGFIQSCDAGDYIAVFVDDENETAIQINPQNALIEWRDEILYVVPRVAGEGAAIVGAAVGAGATALGTTAVVAGVTVTTLTTLGLVVAAVINIAISIAVAAIASLISGSNEKNNAASNERPENKPSYLLNGAVNTTRQGHRIPLLYGGPLLVGSMVLSADINTRDIPV